MFDPEIKEHPHGLYNFVYRFKVTDEMHRASAIMPFSDTAIWSTGYVVWIAAHQEACTLQAKAIDFLKERTDYEHH